MEQHTFEKTILVLIAAAIFPSGPGFEATEVEGVYFRESLIIDNVTRNLSDRLPQVPLR
jgi:hypothetical protein